MTNSTFEVVEVLEGDGAIAIFTEVRPTPSVALKPGDILVVSRQFMTPNNIMYEVGDRLELIEKTTASPYGRTSSLGNWVVKCPHQTSVWAKIEYLLSQGNLELLG